jgi:uncharacterized protein (TIGR02217 family)
MAFHEVRFPAGISLGASGGPERRTEIVVVGSGAEERNSRWADSKRSYNAGYGIKSANDLHAVIAFFEERRGRQHGFRWKDWSDHRSCAPSDTQSAADQAIGTGDGVNATFQLVKTYGTSFAPWARTIAKSVAGTIVVAVAGIVADPLDYAVNTSTGVVTFTVGHIPASGQAVTAGFALRHRPARDQSQPNRGRLDPAYPHRRDQAMRVLSAGLQDHLDGAATTLCWCWRITRNDGTKLGFTDHDRDLAFDGTSFEASTGFTGTEIAGSVGLNVDTLDVEGALKSERLNEADLVAGLYDNALIEIYRVNWADPAQRVLMRYGNLGEVSRGQHHFSCEVRGLAHELQQPKGRIVQFACDADLGDQRCKINLDQPAYLTNGGEVANLTASPRMFDVTVSTLMPMAGSRAGC